MGALVFALLVSVAIFVAFTLYQIHYLYEEVCFLKNEVSQLKEQNKYTKTGFDEWIENGME
jgi:hypothetical protein